MAEFAVVGKRVPRVDAVEKVTGRARYTADLHLPGMLIGMFLRSPYAHARILSIDTSEAEKLPGVHAVITQKSLADMLMVTEDEVHGTRRVQTFFADEKVRYYGEKIAAVAAETREIAEEAIARIKVEYEPLPAVVDVRDAVKEGAPIINADSKVVTLPDGRKLYNVAAEVHGAEGAFARAEGDTRTDEEIEREAFKDADLIFENTYIIHRAHQSYIEPQIAIADVDPTGKVTVWTSTQGHFAVRSNLAKSLNIPLSKINVIGMTIGGGFGAKFGGIVDTYAVLLAMKARRPVKVAYTRREEFLDATPAPGAVITVKTGVKRDGTIVARKAFALWDTGVASGGSYATRRLKGVYNIPNFKFDSYDINTNKPKPGAYRAPGAPQASFASEVQLDEIAHALGMDPAELRLKNMREGDQLAFKEVLRKTCDAAGWWTRTKGPNEGWGLACGEWTNGAGPASATISLHEDGSVHLFYGLMDLTGTDTACAQIAAEVLGVPYEKVRVVRGDTDSAPYGTASGGSVVTFSYGNAVKRAAEEVRRRVLEMAAEALEANPDDLELANEKVFVRGNPDSAITLAQIAQSAMRSTNGPIVGHGSFANEPSAQTVAVQIAKVRVDPETGNVQVLAYWNGLDCGKAINPMAVEGQMEGGVVQGIGWGLFEHMLYAPDGRMINPGLLDYRLPTALDVPKIESILVEEPTRHGPFGVKGVGEPPITPGLAVMANAIYDATGVRVREAPITPERLVMAIEAAQRGNGKAE